MIVDADHNAIALTSIYLTKIGYTPVTAASGMIALATTGEDHIDAILMSIKLSDMTGLEVIKRLNSNKKLAKIPVIIMTEREHMESTRELLKMTDADLIIKPFDPNILKCALEEALAGRSRYRQSATELLLASLKKVGARKHFEIAITLVSIIPLLLLTHLILNPARNFDLTDPPTAAMVIFAVILVTCGYAILARYPISVVRLRKYLELLVKGDTQNIINLPKDENDLQMIEMYLKRIIEQTENRIRTIEQQSLVLLETEKQKVMVESLAAACHHLGQPATVIITYLNMLKDRENDDESKRMITSCMEAADSIQDILTKLQNVCAYNSEPYLSDGHDKIVDISRK